MKLTITANGTVINIDTIVTAQASLDETGEASPERRTITDKDGNVYELLKCREEKDGTIYIFENAICTSDMLHVFVTLDDLCDRFPAENLLKFNESGRAFRLATEKEIFGINEIGNDEPGDQFECMKKRKNRICTDYEDDELIWWWLGTVKKDSSAALADVGSSGDASYIYASPVHGVRPLVKIRDR